MKLFLLKIFLLKTELTLFVLLENIFKKKSHLFLINKKNYITYIFYDKNNI